MYSTVFQELKKHPAFMTEFDPSQEMSPELEGLQQLKYESDSKECMYLTPEHSLSYLLGGV